MSADSEGGRRPIQAQTNTMPHRPYPWILLVNLALLACLYWEVGWWNSFVYQPGPHLPILRPEYIESFLSWLFGFFFLSVLVPLRGGHLIRVLKHPEEHINMDALAILNYWLTWPILVGLLFFFCILILTSPMTHLTYSGPDETIAIRVGGERRTVQNGRLVLPRSIVDAIIISDELQLFPVKVDLVRDARSCFPFWTHKRVAIESLLFRRSFDIKYITPGKVEIMKRFSFDDRPIFDESYLPGVEDPLGLLQEVFSGIYEGMGSYRAPASGYVTFGNKNYGYDYDLKDDGSVIVEIRPGASESLLVLSPTDGVRAFFDGVSPSATRVDQLNPGQQTIIDNFKSDLQGMPAGERKYAYSNLWRTDQLKTALQGTHLQRQLALQLVRHAFGDSGAWLSEVEIKGYIDRIAQENLKKEAGTYESELAVAAICALAGKADRTVKVHALKVLEQYFLDLGADKNVIFPPSTGYMLEFVKEEPESSFAKQVLLVVKIIYRNGSQWTQGEIRTRIAAHRRRLSGSDVDLRQLFDRFLSDPANFS